MIARPRTPSFVKQLRPTLLTPLTPLPKRPRADSITTSASAQRSFSQKSIRLDKSLSRNKPAAALATEEARAHAQATTSSSSSSSSQLNAAASSSKPRYDPRYHVNPTGTTSADDRLLKAHFDDPNPVVQSGIEPVGLFQFPPLTSPQALRPLTERTLIQANAIVARLRKARHDPSGRELRLMIKNLDRLSDTLCGVIDLCEQVRNLHPDPTWIAEAERSHERLSSLMNGLNVDEEMYKSLKAAYEYPHDPPLTQQERQAGRIFLNDFEKCGIHLPLDQRANFVFHSDRLLTLGRAFLNEAQSGPSTSYPIELPNYEKLLSGMGSQFIESLPRFGSTAYVMPGSWEAQMISRFAKEGEARRLVYVGHLRHDQDRVNTLEDLLRERATLAGVLGKESWADIVTGDKMAKTPEKVFGFLKSLADHQRPAAAADVATLQRLKAHSLTGNHYPESRPSTAHLPTLSAWDKDIYSERHVRSLPNSGSLNAISQYLTVGNSVLGLSKLFEKIYGITFKPVPMSPGEGWHPSVRRLDVVDEVEGTIGVIYCDLFAREDKTAPAAHYTVRCSRRVDDDDLAGDNLPEGWDAGYGKGLDVEGVTIKGKEGRHQIPVAVLTCDFGQHSTSLPALLSWTELETLFHEVGHAMHSMIGRTEFHNVSGTRCATDFCEVPSTLMEHFVSEPAVLSLFATHWQTGEPLPASMLKEHLDLQETLANLETHQQIMLSLIDQKFHTISPTQIDSIDTTAMFKEVTNQFGVFPYVEGTAPQLQFGHLHGYGATYYSYLFDRAIAQKMYKTLFATSPEACVSRESGEELKEKVMKWGGGKDPWEMVASVVGGEEGDIILKGDQKAMETVGGWLQDDQAKLMRASVR